MIAFTLPWPVVVVIAVALFISPAFILVAPRKERVSSWWQIPGRPSEDDS